MIVVWATILLGGLLLSAAAAGSALRAAESLGERAGLSPFVIGLTILAIGTDLPEIANSIWAAATDRGDIVVGDATGSTATQVTFVLGVLCFVAVVTTRRRQVAITGAFMVGALAFAGLLMLDRSISRVDGALLVLAWIASTWIIGETTTQDRSMQPSLFRPGVGRDVLVTLAALAAVGIGAFAAVTSFVQITDELGIPEYVTSFFVLSIGTSLPELVVDVRAVRSKRGSMALGDILGSSLVDATLSLGIGPLLFPIEVSDDAVRGTFIVTVVVAAAIGVLLACTTHRWPSGVLLFALYALLYPLLIAG